MRRRRLLTTLMVSFIVIGVLPVMIAGRLISIQSGRLFMREAMEENGEAVQVMGNALAVRLREYRVLTDSLAAYEPARRWARDGESPAEMQALIKNRTAELWNHNAEKIYVHVFSKYGGRRFSTGSVPNLYNLSTYGNYGIFRKAAENTGETVAYANRFTNYSGERICLSLCRALCDDDGEIVGYTVVDILRQDLLNLLRRAQPPSAREVLLLDERSVVVLSSESEGLEGMRLQDETYLGYLEELGGEGQIRIGENSLCSLSALRGDGLWLLNLVTFYSQQRNAEMIAAVTLAVVLITIAAAAMMGALLAYRVGQPVRRLISVFEHTKKGDFEHRFSLRRGDYREIEALAVRYNDMVGQIHVLMETNLEKQRRLNIAELNALESQIKPHFFYNILNDIKSLAKLGRTGDISRLVVAFGRVLRGSLAGGDEFTDVADDLEMIGSYLEMQNIRHDNAIRHRIEVDPALYEEVIPRFILQPIVENAVVHGLAQRERGVILIRGRQEGEDILFEITDNGVGIEPGGAAPEGREADSLHHGIGLQNIGRRLWLHYGEGYGLQIRSKRHHYTQITVRLHKGLRRGG